METVINKSSMIYSVKRDGLGTAFWKTISGSLSKTSTLLNVNLTKVVSYHDIFGGTAIFSTIIPTAPASGDSRWFGFIQPDSGAFIGFHVDGDKLYAEAQNIEGTTKRTEISWSSSWTNSETLFKIVWNEFVIEFYVAGKKLAEFRGGNDIKISNIPYSLYVYNAKNDTMSFKFIALNDGNYTTPAGSSSPSTEVAMSNVYNETSDSLQTSEQNPIYEHNENSPHFIDVQNIADTNTHYAYLDWRTFKSGTLQFIFGGTDTITVKVAVSNEGDTDPTTATYTNASTEILGASSITTDKVVFLDSSIACAFIRVEYTSNNSSSDGDLQVLTYKQY